MKQIIIPILLVLALTAQGCWLVVVGAGLGLGAATGVAVADHFITPHIDPPKKDKKIESNK